MAYLVAATINGNTFPAKKFSPWIDAYMYTEQLAQLYRTHSAESALMTLDVEITEEGSGKVAATYGKEAGWKFLL